MSRTRLAPVIAAVVIGVLAVATAATQAAARSSDMIEAPGGDPAETAAALVLTEVRLLAEVGAFAEPVPNAIVELYDGWALPEEQLDDPLAALSAVEGLAIGMAPELEEAGIGVPPALFRVLRPTDDATWAALRAGRTGVMPGRDHALALVIVVDLMGRPIEEVIAELAAPPPDEPMPMPPWITVVGIGLLLTGVGLAVRLVTNRRAPSVDAWLRELSAPSDAAVVERVALDLVADLLPGSVVRLAPPDDGDPLVASATALGSAARRRGRLAIPAVGHGRVRRVLVVEPAPSRRRVDDLHELASLIGPAIARAEDQQAVADVDPLTDVYNRRRLDRDLDGIGNDATDTALLMVDVDHFKAWNDAHGHHAGDIALRQVAAIIRRTVRPTDVVYRYGGEEFTVLLPGTTSIEASAVAERLRRAVSTATLTVDGEELGAVTISVGLADTVGGPTSTLTERADAALYDAKRSGRDQVVVAGPSRTD